MTKNLFSTSASISGSLCIKQKSDINKKQKQKKTKTAIVEENSIFLFLIGTCLRYGYGRA